MEKFIISKMHKEDVDDVFHIEEIIRPNHHWSKDAFYNELTNNLASYYVIRNEENFLTGFIGIDEMGNVKNITQDNTKLQALLGKDCYVVLRPSMMHTISTIKQVR